MDNTSSQSAGVTFDVDSVVPSTTPQPTSPYRDIVHDLVSGHGRLESHSRKSTPLVLLPSRKPIEMRMASTDIVHGFIETVNLSYNQHYPLTLSPDMIWLLVAQGVASHVLNSAEAVRRKFVAHSGKVKITVRRDEFIRGFEGNDWEGVFSEFSTVIQQHIGGRLHGAIVQNFTTTGIVEKAAFEIALLDAMQNYFQYTVTSLCGIPSITLEGTTEDWKRLRDAVRPLADLELDWWTESLLPVLDQFVDASRGDIDVSFWGDFYKRHAMSGGPYITGHVINFFPYLLSKQGRKGSAPHYTRNPLLGREDFHNILGLKTSQLATGLSVAPFTWEFRRAKISMEFLAGFVGMTQHPETFAVRPEIGWAVVEKHVSR